MIKKIQPFFMAPFLPLILIFFLIFSCSVAYSEKLQVDKLLKEASIKAGEPATIVLQFTNPFQKELAIKLVDKNVFGNNGIDIQCLEYTLPAEKQTTIAYEPIIAFQEGTFTLGKAEVSYTNPDSGKEEKINSNELKMDIAKSATQQGAAQGITTIYQCNGQKIQSTSYSSSGSSMSIQVGGSQISQQSNQQIQQNNVQNNQITQDSEAIKQQMQQQIKEQQDMKTEFQKNLAQNPKFQDEHQKLLTQGYNITSGEINPESNETGSFELNYETERGQEKVQLKGSMENKSLTSFEKVPDALSLLKKDERYRNYNEQLKNSGYQPQNPEIERRDNLTHVMVPYINAKNESAAIHAIVKNESVKEVTLEKKSNWQIFITIFFFCAIVTLVGLFIGIFIYRRLKRRSIKEEISANRPEEKIDYVKESRDILKRARLLHEQGKIKEAYSQIGTAIRFYHIHKHELKAEITNTELYNDLKNGNYMKNQKIGLAEIKKCLDFCTLIEFAKYKPEKKDFAPTFKCAEEIIK